MPRRARSSLDSQMKYSDNIDYLVASILYLGTHAYYWARTPSGLGHEIYLDEKRLLEVFEAFPSIFRKSRLPNENGEHFFSLQARYAQRKGAGTDEMDDEMDIAPLDKDKLDLLISFVLKMTEHEKFDARGKLTNIVAIGAAVASSIAAIVAAVVVTFSNSG